MNHIEGLYEVEREKTRVLNEEALRKENQRIEETHRFENRILELQNELKIKNAALDLEKVYYILL